jgi:hypothetical protein
MSFDIETVIVQDPLDIESAVDGFTHGLEYLAGGLYGKVYGSTGTPYVVKISSGDNGYYNWVQTVQLLGQDCVYVPRIHRVVHYRYPSDHDHYLGVKPHKVGHTFHDRLIVIMEVLTSPLADQVPGSWKRQQNFRRFVSKISHAARLCADGYAYDWVRDRPEVLDWNQFSKRHIELLALLVIARESAGCEYFDLHTGNVMMRGSQFVITDPLCAS